MEHGLNDLNNATTSRNDLKSQPESMMPDVDIDLEQPKVKGYSFYKYYFNDTSKNNSKHRFN